MLAPLLLGVDAIVPWFARHRTEWSRVIDERVNATAATTPSPKVLFVGGSNVPFGINPRSLSAKIKAPVVAYGISAGVGLDLIVARVESMVAPGDIVVLMPELAHFRSSEATDPVSRGDWIRLYGDGRGDPVARFPRRQWIAARERCRMLVTDAEQALSQALIAARQRNRGWTPSNGPTSAYDVRCIDRDGCVEFPLPGPASVIDWTPPALATDAQWDRTLGAVAVRDLARVCRERGARPFFLPGVRAGERPTHAAGVQRLVACEERVMRYAEAFGFERLVPPGSSLLVGLYAFDTPNHLNDAGVALLEDRLVPALTANLSK
ncbi:MAG: hypothetical protein ACKVW3_16935 [Phycisphaerales bacterium]